jgi:hypothetical protein
MPPTPGEIEKHCVGSHLQMEPWGDPQLFNSGKFESLAVQVRILPFRYLKIPYSFTRIFRGVIADE